MSDRREAAERTAGHSYRCFFVSRAVCVQRPRHNHWPPEEKVNPLPPLRPTALSQMRTLLFGDIVACVPVLSKGRSALLSLALARQLTAASLRTAASVSPRWKRKLGLRDFKINLKREAESAAFSVPLKAEYLRLYV